MRSTHVIGNEPLSNLAFWHCGVKRVSFMLRYESMEKSGEHDNENAWKKERACPRNHPFLSRLKRSDKRKFESAGKTGMSRITETPLCASNVNAPPVSMSGAVKNGSLLGKFPKISSRRRSRRWGIMPYRSIGATDTIRGFILSTNSDGSAPVRNVGQAWPKPPKLLLDALIVLDRGYFRFSPSSDLAQRKPLSGPEMWGRL